MSTIDLPCQRSPSPVHDPLSTHATDTHATDLHSTDRSPGEIVADQRPVVATLRRFRLSVIGFALLALTGTSVSAAQEISDLESEAEDLEAEAQDLESEAQDLQGDVTDAIRSLEDLEAAIDEAERELAVAQRRLGEANEALAGLEEQIAQARQDRVRAEQVRDQAVDAVAEAEAEVEAAKGEQQEADARLHRRAIEVYKYGAGVPQQTLVAGVAGASDWHEVAVTTSAVGRILESDRDLLELAGALRREAIDAEGMAGLAREIAEHAEERAREEQAELQVLLDEQQEAVAAVEREQERRAGVLQAFEEDQELVAMLVQRLDDEIASARANAERLRVEQEAAEEAAAQAAAEEAARQEAAREEAAREEAARAAAEAEAAAAEETVEEADESEAEPPPPPPAPSAPPEPPATSQPDDLAWASKLSPAGQQWAPAIAEAARANGVDPRLMAALVWAESDFNPNARSWVGAIGLAQLMPGTAAGLGVDPYDPLQNLDGGARYLARRINEFGSVELGLAAYNAGSNAVWAAGPDIPNFPETQLYVVNVLEKYNQLAS